MLRRYLNPLSIGVIVAQGIFLQGCGSSNSSTTTSENTTANNPSTPVNGYPATGYTPPTTVSDSPELLQRKVGLGEKIFLDKTLSASGQQNCQSCHVPELAFSGGSPTGVETGGLTMEKQGTRAAPTLMYLDRNSSFHFGNERESEPTGGFFWDGRATTFAVQAGQPLLNPNEMANTSKQMVVDKLRKTAYIKELTDVFGNEVMTNTDKAFDALTASIAAFELNDKRFHPYSSKYDEYLRGNVQLTASEARGLDIFNDGLKGNCDSCHSSEKTFEGEPPVFTNFTYDALGVPKNTQITYPTTDNNAYDLGLCKQSNLLSENYCGFFKVPTLRNVTKRKNFMHNGYFHSLSDVLDFYASRDSQPQKWYPKDAQGNVQKFNELPSRYHINVNTKEVPYNATEGGANSLSGAEIQDLMAFLKTLEDGYVKNN